MLEQKQTSLSPPASLQLAVRILAVAIAVPTVIFLLRDLWPYWTQTLDRGQPIGRDAYNFWTAARMCWEGQCQAVYDLPAFTAHQEALIGPTGALNCFLYPPSALVLMFPLGGMAYPLALSVWSLIGLSAFVIAVAAPRFDRIALWLCLLSPMALFNLAMGQTGLLCAALLIGGLRLSGRQPVLAGLLIGLLSFKPVLGVLIPVLLLWRRQWITVVSASLTTLMLALLPVLLWGWDVWTAYIGQAMPLQRVVLHHGSGIGVWMIPSAFNSARLLGFAIAPAYAVHAGFVMAAVALWGAYLWRTRKQAEVARVDILLLATATCLASPYIHNYDFSVVEGAIVLWVCSEAGQSHQGTDRAGLAVAVLWGVGLLSFMLNANVFPIAPLLMLLALWGLSV